MPKKHSIASEPIVSGGAAPARPRKHTPAKRNTPVVESSPLTVATDAPAAPAAASLADPVAEGPTFEEIARLAYSYWEARGCQGGSPEEDWLRAERELRREVIQTAHA